jgi:photosystem II stability/assembly factor-like uncharacterized protein
MAKLILIATFASLAFTSGARAQYVWHVTHPHLIGHLRYQFFVADCFGDVCTAAGQKTDTAAPLIADKFQTLFFRSTDAGETWAEQPLGFHIATWYNITKVQQIDSVNTVAVGDTGLILRTTDGGNTWTQQDVGTKASLFDVHFSDPLTGIVISHSNYSDTTAPNVFTTTDGGAHWESLRFRVTSGAPYEPRSGHSYGGGGAFRIVTLYAGPVYTTHDYWKTADTSFIYDFSDSNHWVARCNYAGDTLVAWGLQAIEKVGSLVTKTAPLFTQSSDGGRHWSEIPLADSNLYDVRCMSGLDLSVTFAAGWSNSGYGRIYRSTDHGATWLSDSTYGIGAVNIIPSISVTPSGHAVALSGPNGQTIVCGVPMPALVSTQAAVPSGVGLFPNPASNILNVESSSGTLTISDPLGRNYAAPRTANTLDISSLPSGVYFVSDGFSRAKFVKE